METLSEMLARNVRQLGDKTFIIAGQERISYRRFGELTGRLANVMAGNGIAKGDRVGLYLPSTPMMAIAFWACQRLGAVPAPISAMFRPNELRGVFGHCGLTAIISDGESYPCFAEIAGELDAVKARLVTGGGSGARDLDRLMAAAPERFDDARCGLSETAALFFTSGTTGTPKAIAQSHFNQCSTLRDMMVAHRTRFAEETYLCAVPLFTNFGLTVTLNLCLYTGGTIVLHERWDTEAVLRDIALHDATYFGGTPTMYAYMVEAFDGARHDLSSLRLCITGGSPVPQPVIARFEALSGAPVAQVYGATETCGQNVIEPTAGARPPGAAGLAVGSSRITIVDEDGAPLPAGEVGEVVIGGDCVAKGYDGDPEATAAAFSPVGWASGDLGYLDLDGFLFVVDRKKDVIITGGHNIYPLEVETMLYRHGDVAICAVVGVPDDAKGQIPVAVIVRAEGATITEAALREWCHEQLSAYKVPRKVVFIDRMPMEAAKIRKRALAEALSSGTLDRYRNA